LEQHQILHSGMRMLAALHYLSPNTNFWTHFPLHFMIPCNQCFVSVSEWLFVSTSVLQ
jgi:hypothetical protein